MDLKDLVLILTKMEKKVWLLSDTHFGHVKCYTEFEPKRLEFGKTFEEFETNLINSWNSHIGKDDIVLHLGDFCINKHNEDVTIKNIRYFTSKLNGIKVLFKGNHDKVSDEIYLKNGWNLVMSKPHIFKDGKLQSMTTNKNFCGSLVIEIKGRNVMFSHFNILFNNPEFSRKYSEEFTLLNAIFKKTECEFNIHGHAHSKVENSPINLNVSVENIKFKPILLNEFEF